MCAFFDYEEITEEDKDTLIEKVAEKIHEYKMETVAVLTLESVKPLAYVGGEMSRVFLAPFLPILGHNLSDIGEKYITVFKDSKNIEKLIHLIEQKVNEEAENKERSRKNLRSVRKKIRWRKKD
jgi:hypothetical protein